MDYKEAREKKGDQLHSYGAGPARDGGGLDVGTPDGKCRVVSGESLENLPMDRCRNKGEKGVRTDSQDFWSEKLDEWWIYLPRRAEKGR